MKMLSAGRMNESLKDVRIVENGVLRNYYIEINFTQPGFATVWFETNISAAVGGDPTSEYDTFMYYGNNNTDFAHSYLMSKNPDGILWYKFEDLPAVATSGFEVVDSMGNYNGTLIGTAWSRDTSDPAIGS